MTGNKEYMDISILMLKQEYAVIPHIFMLESMHCAGTELLVPGAVRLFANGMRGMMSSFPYKTD